MVLLGGRSEGGGVEDAAKLAVTSGNALGIDIWANSAESRGQVRPASTHHRSMEAMQIRVVDVSAGVATVKATSVKCVDGKPQAQITIRLQVPDGPSRQEILDRALAYLDPA